MEDFKENCRTLIKIITNKENVFFTSRCNESIKLVLRMLSQKNKQVCLFQEEGGWLYYEKFINMANLVPIKLITNDGLINSNDLIAHKHESVLLLNSLAGYIAIHDMNEIYSTCIQSDMILINDVSGSIGMAEGKIGDIIVGSFGKGKSVNLGKGGFVSFDDEEFLDFFESIEEADLDFENLEIKLRNLDKRRNFLMSKAQEVKKDLEKYNIVHKDYKGLNVIVRFSNEKEKEELINYCEKNNLEYTICPREIRILDDAISIEVKRLNDE